MLCIRVLYHSTDHRWDLRSLIFHNELQNECTIEDTSFPDAYPSYSYPSLVRAEF